MVANLGGPVPGLGWFWCAACHCVTVPQFNAHLKHRDARLWSAVYTAAGSGGSMRTFKGDYTKKVCPSHKTAAKAKLQTVAKQSLGWDGLVRRLKDMDSRTYRNGVLASFLYY